MKILNEYKRSFLTFKHETDFELLRISKQVLIGEDKQKNTVFVISSNEPNRDGLAQRTKLLSLECNVNINYTEKGIMKKDCCNIIRCYSNKENEIALFFDMCESLFLNTNFITVDYIIEVFSILNDFFTEKTKMSKESAQGLFAELYTIYHYSNLFNFSKCWQNKDKMKFDFSINEKVKLEIKSTTKSERIHRFKHDQLLNSDLEIYVLSYKLLEDNNGISLKDIIDKCIPLLSKYPKKQSRLVSLLHSEENSEIINELKFSEQHLLKNMKFMISSKIPRFNTVTPTNVSHAEYDSNCESVESIDENYIINYFKEAE